MRRARTALLPMLCLSVSVAAQSPRLALLSTPEEDGSIQPVVTNRKTVALEAFVADIRCEGGDSYYFFDSRTPLGFAHDPVKPGASRKVVELRVPGQCAASLDAAVYTDGTFEGSSKAISSLLYWRLAAVSEASYWTPRLKAISGSLESVIALVGELDRRRDIIQEEAEAEARKRGGKKRLDVIAPDARLSLVDILQMNFRTGLNQPQDQPEEAILRGWRANELKYLAFLSNSVNTAPSEAVLLKAFGVAGSAHP